METTQACRPAALGPAGRVTSVTDSVLNRVAMGDAGAVQECLDRFGGLVWSLALRFLGNPTDAEDAVQEIFVDLWKNAERYRPERGSEATFVTVLTRRRLIDRRRRAQRSLDTTPLPDSLPSQRQEAFHHVEVADEAAHAARALEVLRPEQRQVLELAIYHGLSHEAIAQQTQLPLGTVKTHVRRGLIRVRELLAASNSPTPQRVSESSFRLPSASEGGNA